jgi:prepilin-type N-terminal cleavage/methylation domain-containing protein
VKNNPTASSRASGRRGYTLIEVLAASAVIAIGMTAAVSLSSGLMVQEELGWRVAVTRNYQENMARLWQLGLSPADIVAIMPTQSASPLLSQMINGTPSIIETGLTNPGSLGSMQSAAVTAAVNVSLDPRTESQGAPLTLSVYRASLPSALRPPAP